MCARLPYDLAMTLSLFFQLKQQDAGIMEPLKEYILYVDAIKVNLLSFLLILLFLFV